jgi:hypothetical protein
MVSISTARQLALSLPETTEQPHFHLASFRVKNKIFSTLWEAEKKLMVKLSLIDQSVYCDIDKNIIYPVPGGWGRQGATFIELTKAKKHVVEDALTCAWRNSAPKSILKKYEHEDPGH